MAHEEEMLQAGAVSLAFLGLLLGLGYLQREYFAGEPIDPVLVVISLVPVLFFLATTGRLQRFSGGGFEIVLQEQAHKFISPDAAEKIDVEPERLDPKMGLAELAKIKRRSPTALTLELDKRGFYDEYAILEYIEALETLRYVVLTDADDRFQGYSAVADFIRLLNNQIVDVVAEIESGEIVDNEVVYTQSIHRNSTNEECLRAMNAHRVDELAVVDSDGRFVGVMTQDAIIRELMSSAIASV